MSKKIKFIAIVLIAFLISMGVFEYFFLSLNQVQATNNYIEDIVFKKNSDDLAVVSFKVKTTFEITIGAKTGLDDEVSYCLVGNAESAKTYGPGYNAYATGFWPIENSDYTVSCDRTWTFTAGTTHTVLLGPANAMRIRTTTDKICILGNCPVAGDWDIISKEGDDLTSANYISDLGFASYSDWWILNDTDDYYFTEYPTITTTYPADLDEIEGAFTITGTITQPSPYDYNYIQATIYWYNPDDPTNYFNQYFITAPYKSILATSTQEFELYIQNLPKSDPNYLGIQYTLTRDEGEWFWSDEITRMKTMYEIGTWPPVSWTGDNVLSFFNTGFIDIFDPIRNEDGYYYIATPTSTITFIIAQGQNQSNKVWLEQGEQGANWETLMATTTLSDLSEQYLWKVYERKFDVDNVNSATSTTNWVRSTMTDYYGNVISENAWNIRGLEEGETGKPNVFIQAIYDAFEWLTMSNIRLSDNNIERLFALGDITKTKIPFSYFYEIQQMTYGLSASTSTAFSSFKLDVGGVDIDIDFMDATYLQENGFIDGMKDLFEIAIVAMLFMYCYDLGRAGPKKLQHKH